MNKLLVGLASLAMVAAPLAASAQSFDHGRDGGSWNNRSSGGERQTGRGSRGGERSADGRGYRYSDDGRRYGRDDGGSVLGAGIVGLFLGSALSSQQYGYGQSYGYGQPYAYDGTYGVDCGWQTQAYEGPYGDVQYRQVEVCR